MYRLEQGEIDTPPAYRNKYRFEIKYMHGDADAYDTTTYTISDPQEALDIVTFWIDWQKLDWNYRCDVLADDKLIDSELSKMDLSNFDHARDLFKCDVTTNADVYAHFDTMKIYWYDAFGIKYNVNVLDDNDCIVKI